jgi:hydroxymethylpyrimidine/phosphomethylpyrimidine kinase
MLHDPEVAQVVADAIKRYNWKKVVLDPVMVATSGDRLIAQETVAVLVQELFPLATLITPNLDEAALLWGRPLQDETQLEAASTDLLKLGAPAVLLKGGHLASEQLVDVLAQSNQSPLRMTSMRVASRNTHGTGCTLSSAIACYLALDYSLADAVQEARRFVYQAIEKGADVQIGAGHGPLNHAFAPVALRRVTLSRC